MRVIEDLRALVGNGRGVFLPRRGAEISEDSVPVRHQLNPPPSNSDKKVLAEILKGTNQELLSFYCAHDGAALHCDENDEGSGLFFFPIEDMAEEKSDMLLWFDRDEEPEEDRDASGQLEIYGWPDWLDSSIVFAGFGFAPERFLTPADGPWAGKIFLFDHDPHGISEIAGSFKAFVEDLRYAPGRWNSYLGQRYYGQRHYEPVP